MKLFFCILFLGGKFMKFDCATLFRISKAPMRNHSPTDELLTLWGEQNHTVLELFTILYEMRHYHAMTILKSFGMKCVNNMIVWLKCLIMFFFSYFQWILNIIN